MKFLWIALPIEELVPEASNLSIRFECVNIFSLYLNQLKILVRLVLALWADLNYLVMLVYCSSIVCEKV